MNITIAIATDHAAYDLKEYIKANMPDINWRDLGCHSTDSVDYPDYAVSVSQAILSPENNIELGVLLCGSGIGVSIAANKYAPAIRAALVHNIELAELSRKHNNANILCMGAKCVSPELAVEIVKKYLATEFSTEERHVKRVEMITS